MTDFFTRLAERTLGMALTVQPVIAPIFAPEHNRTDTGLFEATAEVGTHLNAPGRKTEETGSDVTSGRGERRSEKDFSWSATSPGKDSRGEQPQAPTSVPFLPEPAFPLNTEGEHKNQLPYEFDRSPEKSVLVEVANTPTMDEQSHTGSEVEPTRSALDSLRSQASFVDDPYNGQPQGRRAATIQPSSLAALTRERPQENVTFVGAVKREVDVMGKAPPLPEMPNPAPTIQVTIGRIEVRATSSATTPARQQQQSAKPPVMGLDEYLQRAKGGR